MSRTKAKKSKARSQGKKQSTFSAFASTLKKMDGELINTATTLVVFLTNELYIQENFETKLRKKALAFKKDLDKINSQIKSLASQTTAKGEKTRIVAKKKLALVSKAYSQVNDELTKLQQLMELTAAKREKFAASIKLLKQFDKNWQKEAKAKVKLKAASKPKTKAKSNIVSITAEVKQVHDELNSYQPSTEETEVIEQPLKEVAS